jgi:glycerophosphoryl diester phosphodiesterase
MRGGFKPMIKIVWVLTMAWTGEGMGFTTSKHNLPMTLPWTPKFPVYALAHRGFSGDAPENTLAAFKKAIDLGVDMIELDVQLSKDGKVVVIHDDTLNRTTHGTGKVVNVTFQALKQLDAGSWFGPAFLGEQIPTLRKVLELARNRILLMIELKKDDPGKYTMADLADRSLQVVEQAGMQSQVLFASFDPEVIERVKKKNGTLPVVLILSRKWNFPLEVTGGKSIPVLSCHGNVLNPANVARAHEQGHAVMVWTVNEEEEMQHFLHLGVDGIIANHPDRLIRILQNKAP